jgi:hypothetical protein
MADRSPEVAIATRGLRINRGFACHARPPMETAAERVPRPTLMHVADEDVDPVTTGLEGYERIAVRVELVAGSHLLGSALSETLTLG